MGVSSDNEEGRLPHSSLGATRGRCPVTLSRTDAQGTPTGIATAIAVDDTDYKKVGMLTNEISEPLVELVCNRNTLIFCQLMTR